MNTNQQICITCGEPSPLSDFPKRRDALNRESCSQCRRRLARDVMTKDSPPETSERTCKICGIAKPLLEFASRRRASGRKSWRWECKPCHKKLLSKYFGSEEERAAAKAKQRAAFAALSEQEKEEYRATRRANYPKEREVKRLSRLRRQYGIEYSGFASMFASQNGLCALCDQPPADGKKLVVDHSHDTGAVRGLLCDACNLALALVEKCSLDKVASYLSDPPGPRAMQAGLPQDDPNLRLCHKCGSLQPLNQFTKTKTTGRIASWCRQCTADSITKWRTREGMAAQQEQWLATHTEKPCPKCKRTLPIESFTKCRHQATGLYSYCKECHKELQKNPKSAPAATEQDKIHSSPEPYRLQG